MTCRACLAGVVVGANSAVRPTVVVVVAVPTLDEFRIDGLSGGEDCVRCSLSLLLLWLLVATVVPCWVPYCIVVHPSPAPPSGVLLLHLCGWVWCTKWSLLHLHHHLLLIDSLVSQLLLQMVVRRGQLLVGGGESVDGRLRRIVRGCELVDGFIE